MKMLLLLLLLGAPIFLFADTVYEAITDEQNNAAIGPMTREQILAMPVFNYFYLQYSPKGESIEAIHNYSHAVEIKVFFGDWCKDSKKHVPAFLKVMEMS